MTTAIKKAKVESFDISKSDETLFLAVDLAKFIKEQKLFHNIQGKEYNNVEGWQYAGNRLGILPIMKELVNISTEEELKYRCHVELINLRTDKIVGSGFAICSNKESGKKYYQEFAIASMAQTRAIGKAYRNILAWIIRAAGYEPTPAEEMDYMSTEVVTEKKADPFQKIPASQNFQPTDRPHVSKEKGAEAAIKAVEREHQLVTESTDEVKPISIKQKTEFLLLLNNEWITPAENERGVKDVSKMTFESAEKAIAKLIKTIEKRESKNYINSEPATIAQIERLNYLHEQDEVKPYEKQRYIKTNHTLTAKMAFDLIEYWEKIIPARRAVEAEQREESVA
jgi:hypothetical protein